MASNLQKLKRKEGERSQLLASLKSDLLQEIPRQIERALPPAIESVLIEHRQEFFSGPIPSPKDCQQYEVIMPGFTDRAFTIVEVAQRNEAATTKRRDIMEFSARIFGLLSALILGSLAVIFGFLLIRGGNEISGFGSLLAGAGIVVGAFIGKSAAAKKT